jgi:hypothetical protein
MTSIPEFKLNKYQKGHNMNTITAAIETITPHEAQRRLSKTTITNRSLSSINIKRIAEAMRSGEFQFNGEALIHDDEENILDGQHRYAACVQSNVPFVSVVVRGVPRAAFATIDSGVKRTAANVLTIAGHKNTTLLAAAALRVHAYRSSLLFPIGSHGHQSQVSSPSSKPSAAQLAEYVDALGNDFIQSVRWVNTQNTMVRSLRPLAPGFLVMIVHELGDREYLGREFFKRVASGAGLEVNSPELALRNYLNSMLALSTHRRAHTVVVAACAVKALNASLERKEIKLLRYNDKEAFPVVGGARA